MSQNQSCSDGGSGSEAQMDLQECRQILLSAPVGVFKSTPEGNLLCVNPALASMCGQGIAEDELDMVFDTFCQAEDAESPYSRQFEGAGLGLPLVKRLIDLMKGNACIVSQKSAGTTVYVSLPFRIPKALQEKAQEPQGKKSTDLSGFNILLVDDEQSTQFYIQRLLQKYGAQVSLATDGEQALAMLERESFDCVLMDVQMPVMDGVEATKQIRSSKSKFKDIPIIALTAYAMLGDREKFLEAGMDDYISKPVNKDELLELIERYVSR